ncbi:hypothetical protein [Kocuria sp.]|uniref:hypothetical protein n=1 Tax=Kocuria sp. TaxID=1871328 RepID=UPI0026DECA1B|nr:hypothetical protein [Kocuria sp.]MDO5619799.1 hypothetical protein [Kocuria sp.]
MTTYALNDRGSLEIVTENFYDAEILRVFGALSYGSVETYAGTAELVPEPDNPVDPQTIAVRVGADQVGHLTKEDAARYWPAVTRVVASDLTPTAPVIIKASLVDADGVAEVDATARIQLSPPDLLFPVNAAPQRSTVLPQGSSIKVLDEQDHAAYLHAILPASGEARLFLTLEVNQVRTAHGDHVEIVEVLHERQVVGRFSTQLSEQFIPVIRHAFEHDLLTAAWGTIRGSAYEVSLTVQAARPEAIDPEWYALLPRVGQELVPEADSYPVPNAYVPTEAERGKNARKWRKGMAASGAQNSQSRTGSSTATRVDHGAAASWSQSSRVTVWILAGVTLLLLVVSLVFLGREPLVSALAVIVAAATGGMALYLRSLFGPSTANSARSAVNSAQPAANPAQSGETTNNG